MAFAHPWALLAASVAAMGFATAYLLFNQHARRAALVYSNLDFLIDAVGQQGRPLYLWTMFAAGSIGSLAASAAGPYVRTWQVQPAQLVICIDTSGSMATADILPSRAEAVRFAVDSFVAQAPLGTGIGIVAFAGEAHELLAPTPDHRAVARALESVPDPNGPTAIGDAIALAHRILPRNGVRAIVLLTDGINNTGTDPAEAVHQLRSDGIRLYAVGIGSGRDIDEGALRRYASVAAGTYGASGDAAGMQRALLQLAGRTWRKPVRVDLSLAFALMGGSLLALLTLASVSICPGLGTRAPEPPEL